MVYSKKLTLLAIVTGLILILCALADDAARMQPFEMTAVDVAGLTGGVILIVLGVVLEKRLPEGSEPGRVGSARRFEKISTARTAIQIGMVVLIGALLFALPAFIQHTSQPSRFFGRYGSRYFAFLAGYVGLIAGIAGLLASSLTAWGRRKIDVLLEGASPRLFLWLLLLSTVAALGWLVAEPHLWFGNLPPLDIAASVPAALSILLTILHPTNDSSARRAEAQEARGDWISAATDGALILLAAWTLATNLAYFLNRSLLFAVAPFILIGMGLWLLLRRVDRAHPACAIPDFDQPQPGQERIVFAAIGIGMWGLALLTGRLIFIWVGVLATAASLLFFDLRSKRSTAEAAPVSKRLRRGESWLVIALCVIGTAFALTLNRPDKDDSAYHNLAAAVADAPHEPIPHSNPLFSNEDYPYAYPTFPLMSIYHLIGLVSLISGVEPLMVSSVILLPVCSILMTLAYARLFQTLAPKNWLWMLTAIWAVFLIDSSTRVMFTNYGFTRIWQGKAFFFHVLMPLAGVYAFRFGATGNRRDWLLLLVVQIAMISTTSMAIWMGPSAAGIALLAGVVYAKAPFKRLLAGLGTSLYPLAIGLGAYVSTRSVIESRLEIVDWADNVAKTFGTLDSPSLWAWLGFILLALILAPNRRSRLLVGFSYVVVFGLFWNPLFKDLVAQYITSSFVYWRIVWMLPLPVIGAVILSSPARFRAPDGRAQAAIIAGCVTIYTLLVPSIYIFSPENEVSVEPFSVKADRGDYAATVELTGMLPPRSLVIAPEEIGWILPTLRGYLQPIAPRHNQLRYAIRDQLGDEDEYEFRAYLLHYAAGKRPFERAAFEQALERWDIRAVVVTKDVRGKDELAEFLESAGFEQRELGEYLLWVAPQ